MNTVSRTITGAVATLFGLFLTFIGFTKDPWILLYGIPIIIIGVYIFFNTKEDDIEEINELDNIKE